MDTSNMRVAEPSEAKTGARAAPPSDAHYRSLFEAAQDAILLLVDGVLVDVNPKAEAILGASRAQLLGLGPLDLSPSVQPDGRSSPEAARAYIEAALAGAPQHFEWQHQRVDGTPFDAEVSLNRFELAEGPALLGIVRDVTEQRRMQRALVESEARYRLLAEEASDMLSRHDLQGTYTYVSPAVRELLGYEPEEVVGTSAYSYFHPRDLPAVTDSHRAVLWEEPTQTVTYRARTKSGEYKWLETTSRTVRDPRRGHVLEIVAVTRDVSERYAAQEALRLSEARLRGVLTNLPVIVFSTDGEGVFTLSEGLGLERIGLAQGQAVGASAFEMYAGYPEVVAALRAALAGAFRRIRVRVGEAVFELSLAPLEGPDGDTGVLGVAADVTEQAQAEEARLKLQRQLLDAQKLETVGVLAGGVAHDFNNLLSAMLGNLELALDDLPEGAHEARESIGVAVEAARRAAVLTKQMLAYAGKGRLALESLDLAGLLAGQEAIVQGVLPKTARLEWAIDAPLPTVHADPTQLQQLLFNLATNAAEAVGERGSKVTVRARARRISAEGLAASRLAEPPPPGAFVCLEVEDDGPGMDPVTLAQCHEPFFSTKYPGRGLGLAAVSGIVRAHGGVLLIDSSPGEGTRVQVLLPCEDDAVARSAPHEEEEAKVKETSAPTVLVVDDEDGVRALCARMLSRLGYRVIVAEDGERGVRALASHKDEVDCVLLDLTLPDMDGVATFERMREVREDVSVVIASGYGASHMWPELDEKGIRGVIDKPYGLEALREQIQRAIGAGP